MKGTGASPLLERTLDCALWTAIVLAPVAGGSSHRAMLPVLGLTAAVAFCTTLLICRQRKRPMHVTGLPLGLAILGLIALFQALPLPPALLGLLSPRLLELRSDLDGPASWSALSYEPQASGAEAAKLLLFGSIALAAYERARLHGRFRAIAVAVAIAGLSSALVAVIHRALGAEQMLGLLPSARPAAALLTTFVNPNHAAGFMMLSASCALGVALSARRRVLRIGFLAAAAACVVVSVLSYSRGGLLALALALVLSAVLLLRRRSVRQQILVGAGGRDLLGAGAIVLLAFVALGVGLLHPQAIEHEFDTRRSGDPFGVMTKFAAMKDAWPLIVDHPILGIGRGAYGSVYPGYKTTPLQLTFTHPENLVVELVSDFGPIAGLLALVGLGGTIYLRCRRNHSVIGLAALAGISALVIQNFVDFSLDMPGVAIPVAALLGGAGVASARPWRLSLDRPLTLAAVAAVGTVPLLFALVATFALPNAQVDLDELSAAIESRVDRSPAYAAALAPKASAHPANAVIATKLAYLAETSAPRDLRGAMRWANRAMLLAPNYADAHLIAGRLLLRGGQREQGFGELRTAWTLAKDSSRVGAFMREIVFRAKSPAELALALPQLGADRALVDEAELARVSRYLREIDRREWALALFETLDSNAVRPEHLLLLAQEADRVGAVDMALSLLILRTRNAPDDINATRALVDVHIRERRFDEAERAIDGWRSSEGVDPFPILRARVQLRMEQGDLERASLGLDELDRGARPTRSNQVSIARLRSDLELRRGRPAQALDAISRAIQIAPSTPGLLVARARILLSEKRVRQAQADLEAALRIEPSHREARTLLARVNPKSTEAMRE